MILTYLKTTENMVPDAWWEARLGSVSKKFREIKNKALSPPAVAVV